MGTIRNGVRGGEFRPVLDEVQRGIAVGKIDLCLFTGEIIWGRRAAVGAINHIRENWAGIEKELLANGRPEGVVYLQDTPLSLYGAAKAKRAFGCETLDELLGTVSESGFASMDGVGQAVKDEFKAYCVRRGLCFANS